MNAGKNDGVSLLRLKAMDEEDLVVMSGSLQDAIVPVGDMVFAPGDRQFILVANRYRWELEAHGIESDARERVNCAVTVSNVLDIKRRGIDFADRGLFLDLLSLTCGPSGTEGRTTVDFTFAGDAAIRLETTGLLCHLEDFGEPWPTQWRPRHADD